MTLPQNTSTPQKNWQVTDPNEKAKLLIYMVAKAREAQRRLAEANRSESNTSHKSGACAPPMKKREISSNAKLPDSSITPPPQYVQKDCRDRKGRSVVMIEISKMLNKKNFLGEHPSVIALVLSSQPTATQKTLLRAIPRSLTRRIYRYLSSFVA